MSHSSSYHKHFHFIFIYKISFSNVKLLQERGADTKERCHQLQRDLAQSHQDRDSLIRGCIKKYSEDVASLEASGDKLKRRAAQNMVSEAEAANKLKVKSTLSIYQIFYIFS